MTLQQMCNLATAVSVFVLCLFASVMLAMIVRSQMRLAWRRFRRLGILKRIVATVVFAGFVVWGGTKPKPDHINVRLIREPDDTLHPAATITNMVSDAAAATSEERTLP